MSDVKPCCQDEKNLSESPVEMKADLTVRVCAVCGCRHFELTVDPLHLAITEG